MRVVPLKTESDSFAVIRVEPRSLCFVSVKETELFYCALKQDKTTGYAGGVKKLQLQEKSSFVIIKSPARHENKGGFFMNNSSLAHTKWECKYHVVFAPKYRRQIIYGKLKADIGKIL